MSKKPLFQLTRILKQYSEKIAEIIKFGQGHLRGLIFFVDNLTIS